MSTDMHISRNVVGLQIPPMERRVGWRDTMNYAAAVLDLNPRYFDDTTRGGLVAPPMFAVAATWPMVTSLQNLLGEAIPPAAMMMLVHAAEHIVFHQPLRPGRTLLVCGTVTALKPTPAGALMTLLLEAAKTNGEPVFTQRVGAMFRGIDCERDEMPDEVPAAAQQPEADAQPAWEVELSVRPEAAHIYDGCTNIVFPIHTSRAFALGAGLPGIVLQGTATLAMAARELLDREANGDPCCLKSVSGRFTGMVLPGDRILVRAWRGTQGRVWFKVLDKNGGPAIDQGTALLA